MTSFNPVLPYNQLPPVPPPGVLESHGILKLCIEARSALAELKQAGQLIPNQSVLINTIPIREARDSSAIENIITTDDNLFRHAANEAWDTDPATKETHRYARALFMGFLEIANRPLNTNTAVSICKVIRDADIDIRTTPGTVLQNSHSGEVIYTPPEGETLIREMLANWEQFLHRQTDLDPLVRMAIGHYQFEAIHPFTDGNGRTGRILNIIYLIEQGLLEIPVLYLSGYFIDHRDDYYSLLQKVTEKGAWEEWITFMLSAILLSAQWTTRKIKVIRKLQDHTLNYARRHNISTHVHDLIDLTFTRPYCRISHVVEADIAKRATASRYLRQLAELGILDEQTVGREKVFLHTKFLDLLLSDNSEFARYPSE